MASTLNAVVSPKFLLPKISQRCTAVRPFSLAARSYSPTSNALPVSFPRGPRYHYSKHFASILSCRRTSGNKDASPGSIGQSIIIRRQFSATPTRPRDHHFDTLKFVQRLKDEGFTEEQGVAMMKVLSDVIEESIQNLTRTMVLREDQEKVTYTQKVDFAKLRSELLGADSTESSLSRASHERLTNELAKLNSRLRDEIQRTQASVRLDLNLEKGRIREEANVQELKIKETETRIEQETAVLRERLEAVKFSTLQWLIGVCTGTAALLLGAWRLLM
ncbi:DUF1640-domain-containing protein [Tothia fuscella]|uniref:DUF1640-domain-containing protein n=1 Tax=Tothia fuscella TaxID=1048955 RepID=A0A9P4NYI3_9PEZI|nr:DUF1640-domain-containing protein [Tothia fuscella]